MKFDPSKKVVLTGDRPTGKLHIGHYVGSLKERVKMQNSGNYNMFIMIADQQALTDNARDPRKDPQQSDSSRIRLSGSRSGPGQVNDVHPVPDSRFIRAQHVLL
jgi:hypothetical protein